MSNYCYPQAENNMSYNQKRHTYEEPVNCEGNSKRQRFDSPYGAPGDNKVRVSENEGQKEIALDEKPANVEEMDKTNTKIQLEELKLDMKVLEESNKRLKDRVRHLITDNTSLTNIYDAMKLKQQILKLEMEKIKVENANFTSYNMELTNKLRAMEEETKKVQKGFDDLMCDYPTLQCETKRIKEEPGQIESLNYENVQLTEKCAAHEAELLQLSEELKKSRAETGEMKAKYNELSKQNKELNEGNEKTVTKLNENNVDLKLQCDNVEGEKLQLKGEMHQIKHKLREMEVEKSQSDLRMAIFEKEKEALLIRCKEKDGKNEKLETENKKFKDLIQQFQGFMQKKVQEMADGDDVEVLGEKSGEDLNSSDDRVEIHPNSGVFCRASDWRQLEKCKEPKDFSKELLQLIFAKEELLKCSVKGKCSRPALNEAKTDALCSCVLNRFPEYASELDLTRVVNNMLNNIRQNAKKMEK